MVVSPTNKPCFVATASGKAGQQRTRLPSIVVDGFVASNDLCLMFESVNRYVYVTDLS
jgi:hypothetical protein